MRRVLIVLALVQIVFLLVLEVDRLGRINSFLANAIAEKPAAFRVRQAFMFETSGVEVSGVTPGFVEGYVVARSQDQVNIETSFSQANGWTLVATVGERTIEASAYSLSDACMEILDEYYQTNTNS